jgi:hypothetical protein
MQRRVVCHACSADLEVELPLGRSSLCRRCGSDLRCCLNCRFHDLSSYNDCAEPSAERVLEKDRANFCDYFSPLGQDDGHETVAAATGEPAGRSGLDELERLFRKG